MDNVLIVSEDGTTVISCDKNYSGEIIIPDGIINIGAEAFANCSISRVVFPNTLKKIGRHAFDGCIGLKCLTLKMKNVGYALNEFKDCSNVEVIKIKHFVPNLCIGLQGFKKLKKIIGVR